MGGPFQPTSQKECAHVESFNSILEREGIRRFEFESDEEPESTVGRFVDFHNNGRMHMAIDYNTPMDMNKICMEEFQKA
jgi:putative transposase